jgi:polysaccharide chain length determinant protein (PEP-CTERM system associated)
VDFLLRTLVNETLGGKREGSQSAQQFLETQIKDYEQRLRTAEDRLADFKSRHLGLMPTEQGGYFAQLQAEDAAVAKSKTDLAKAESRRAALEKQLHGDAAISAVAPTTPVVGGSGVAAGDTVSRIAETQAKLDDLLLRFTDKHPDVIATRQTLEELKRRRAQEIESLKRGDANAAAMSRASTNPVFQSVQQALNNSEVEIADLRTELAQHEAKAQELRRLLDTAPQVEAEYAQLNRDYDVNKAQYTALLANYEKARLGERADDAGSVRFEIVQPPVASIGPVFPPRMILLAGVLLLALAAGGAGAYGMHQLRPVINSANGLAQLTGVPVLGAVGSAYPSRAQQVTRRDVRWLTVATACLVMVFAVAVTLSRAGVRLSVPALKHLVNV